MLKPDRKATDEEIHILVHEADVPVAVLADLLETSRGHIYKCLARHDDPVAFQSNEREYRATRKARGLRP